MNKKWMFLVPFAIYAGIHFFYLDKYPTPWWDEFFYTEPSWQLPVKKAFIATIHPDIGHMGVTSVLHGRFFLWINVVIFKILGYTLFTLRLQSLLAGLAAIGLTYLIGKELFSSKMVGGLRLYCWRYPLCL